MYIKCITPQLKVEMAPGDIVQAGVVISNSEVGQGTLSVQPLLYRLVCRNGLIASDRSLRKTHVGRALGSDESIMVFKDDTLQADDKAFFLKVRDVVQAAVSEATFMQAAQKMQKTLQIHLVGNPVKTVEVLAQRYTLNDAERAGVLRHLIAEGDLSGYGLVNAVTHFSQEVEDYDRATEFEALGGKLIELPVKEWKELAQAL
jgi:DNA-binding phage protein